MSKLKFVMDDFAIHESVSYLMRDLLAKSIQVKFDKWFEENHKNRWIGEFKVAPAGTDQYAIFRKSGPTLFVKRPELEELIQAFYEKSFVEKGPSIDSSSPGPEFMPNEIGELKPGQS